MPAMLWYATMKFSQVVAAISSYNFGVSDTAYTIQVKQEGPNVTYVGFERNGVEVWLGIQYGQNISGRDPGLVRFNPAVPFVPSPDTVYYQNTKGAACWQSLGQWLPPLTLENISNVDEDCLNLNIVRPKGNSTNSLLPVMVWIHGGSFWTGSNNEPTHQPDSLVLESVSNGRPIIHVAINYRLGIFGFAQSEALKKAGSMNAGLRDQRLAIEWVRNHILAWGGDPNKITIFGQSSGGLAVGMQLLAYGGAKPLPYQYGICESQALEPGITGTHTIDAMQRVCEYLPNCKHHLSQYGIHSQEVMQSLQAEDAGTLFNASIATHLSDINHNIGDVWLPAVDDDFLPAAPSQLLKDGRFGKANYMIGWTDGDVNFFTNFSLATPDDTSNFVKGYLPAMPDSLVHELLDLYPSHEFIPPADTNLTTEFYRSARIFRDILMVCQPIHLAETLRTKGIDTHTQPDVFLYNWNQTILDPILAHVYNVSQLGVVHTSEFAYVYGNFSHWNVSGYPWNPSPEDYLLLTRSSRTWSNFATTGAPGMQDGEDAHDVLAGWYPLDWQRNNTAIYVIGGPREGMSTIDGLFSSDEMRSQRLRERCGFINSERIIPYLQC